MRIFVILFIFVHFSAINGEFRERIRDELRRNDLGIDNTRLSFLGLKEEDEWRFFKAAYNKQFTSEDEERDKRQKFERTQAKIIENQKNFAEGKVTYVLGINKFADVSPEEFQQTYLTVGAVNKQPLEVEEENLIATDSNVTNLESGLDLRVTDIPVKDQKSCGSCWAYSGVAILEFYLYLKYGKYIDLSEQIAMDCARRNGCNGGFPYEVLSHYVKKGLPEESVAPYMAKNAKCRSYRKLLKNTYLYNGVKNGPTKWFPITPNTEDAMRAALHQYGWLTICVNANQWQFYMGGVMTDDKQDSGINHAVVLVGYGHDKKTNLNYWIIRNSWGSDWGEGGYIRIACDVNAFNICSAPGTTCGVS